MENKIKGYKVTDAKMQCRGYQYELNKLFKHNGSISPCNSGFHFCVIAADCFNYYSFNPENRVFEVEGSGNIINEGDKNCCSEIIFIRELSWSEVLSIVNSGKGNTGLSNSGDSNSGDSNSGNSNSGNSNSGNWNSGDSNSGNWNSGDRNSGDSNSGNWNSGDRNSGNWNSGNRNSGAFCTDVDPKMILFNKPCKKMTVKEWEDTEVCNLMYGIYTTIWVPASIMTDAEKKTHPNWETTEGFLRSIPIKEAWANFWGSLAEDKRRLFTELENFDAAIFEEITGIKI